MTSPYGNFIGIRYRVIADDLYAYAIRQKYGDEAVSWIVLIPGAGIGGPEVAFRRHVPKGSAVRILSAWHVTVLFEKGIYYEVSVSDVDLPDVVPIRLELARGNEGADGDLNPSVYQKMAESR